MDRSPSIRSCSRARTSERGFALALALIVAVLYFGHIELLLIDASHELAQARRFRARIVALTLAENGAELAALHLAKPGSSTSPPTPYVDWQGEARGTVSKSAPSAENGSVEFKLTGTGDATGVVALHATVYVQGRIQGRDIAIDWTNHSQ
jgi:hypothetical protein